MADLKPQDVIEVLTQDHREVEELFVKLEGMQPATTAAQRKRRKDLVDQVTIELVRHSVAEETEVYPAVKEKVSKQEADRAAKEHAEAERTMKRLERLKPEDSGFDAELATLMREIREHVAEEEGKMFPRMREVFSQDELDKLGSRVKGVKMLAPTRPHPSTAPRRPPVDLVTGPAIGLFDRLRDAVSGRGIDR
jgi:hemerythrin superfamily protein